MKKRKTIVVLLTVSCILLFFYNLTFADYIHGYFRYTVSDNSVTITGYYGDESVVTVPAMIGGNPVNTIASSAFAGSSVSVVYLPDTIMSIEGGAFGPGQSVVYNSFSMTASETGTQGDDTTGTGETTDPSEIPTSSGPVGIWDDQGNLLTTDDEHNLILVDPEGNETVLDNTQDYGVDQDGQGNVSIWNEAGGEVTVHDGSTIEYTDVEGRIVSTDTATGSMTITDPKGGFSYEEAEINLEEEPTTVRTASVEKETTAKTEDVEGSKDLAEEETATEKETEEDTEPETVTENETLPVTDSPVETESLAESEETTETESIQEEIEAETKDEMESLTETEFAEETQVTAEVETESGTGNDTTRAILWPIIIVGLVVIIVVIILVMRRRSRR